ncbi:MAG: bifunctional metallophosphatase/5'-nucleotidase [Candidatus Riflebacteria bacterium]|nr:bifunctional metallophosphatase/5'-nucleotidase [Candidatus Riflebacteria bacterium]
MFRNLMMLTLALTLIMVSLYIGDFVKKPSRQIIIFYTSNLRGQIKPFSGLVGDVNYKELGGMAFIKSYIDKTVKLQGIDPANVLVLDTGDALFGTAEATLTMGETPLSIMEQVGYDAMAVGNFEFEFGMETLRKFVGLKKVPMLAANYKDLNERPGLKTFEPFLLVTKGNVKCGIIGLGLDDIARNTRQENIVDLEVKDLVTSANEAAKQLKAQGADLVILISHNPMLASHINHVQHLQNIDVVISDFVNAKMRTNEPPMICLSPPSRGAGVGVLKLTEKAGKWELNLFNNMVAFLDSSSLQPDPEINRTIASLESQLDTLLNQPLTYCKENFATKYNAESDMGNLITSLMKEITGADIAMTNSGGIKAGFSEGPLLLRNLYEAIPFDNNLFMVTLKGWEIENLVEQSLTGRGTFLQSSGIDCLYTMENPKGFRILQIFINDIPLEAESEYTVAINDFMYKNSIDWPEFSSNKTNKVCGLFRDEMRKLLRTKPAISPDKKQHYVLSHEGRQLHRQPLTYPEFPYANLQEPDKNKDKFRRSICELMRQEAGTDIAILPASVFKRDKNYNFSTVTPQVLVDTLYDNVDIYTLDIQGASLAKYIKERMQQMQTSELLFTGFSLENKSGKSSEHAIINWSGIFSEDHIYSLAITRQGLDDIISYAYGQPVNRFNDIRRLTVNGLKHQEGFPELRSAFY